MLLKKSIKTVDKLSQALVYNWGFLVYDINIKRKPTIMTNNNRLAQIVAERLQDRLEEQMTDLIQEITVDVLEENGLNTDDDDAWETMMDVAGRIYIGAQ